MTTTPKYDTWIKRITDSDVSKRLSQIHNEVVELFNVNSAAVLSESACKSMMDSVKDFEVDTMIIYSLVTESIATLHHTSKIGEEILNKEETYFSLLGHGATTYPLVFKPISLLTITEVTCPT